MKILTPILIILCLTRFSVHAEVVYSVEPIKVSDKGRLQWKVGSRGDTVVHKVLMIDRGNKGVFDEFTEQFFVDGKVVLTLSKISGDYMVDCVNLGSGVVSLYYQQGRSVPYKMYVGADKSVAEVYTITADELHLAMKDEDRKRLLDHMGPLPANIGSSQNSFKFEVRQSEGSNTQ